MEKNVPFTVRNGKPLRATTVAAIVLGGAFLLGGCTAQVGSGVNASPSGDATHSADGADLPTPPGTFVEGEYLTLYVEEDHDLGSEDVPFAATVFAYPESFVATEGGGYFPWVPTPSNDDPVLYDWQNMSDIYVTPDLEAYLDVNLVNEGLLASYDFLSLAFDSSFAGEVITKAELPGAIGTAIGTRPWISLSDGLLAAINSAEYPFLFSHYGENSQPGGVLPTLLEDGAPRSLSQSPYIGQLSKVEAVGNGSETFLKLTFDVRLGYRVSDESAREYLDSSQVDRSAMDWLDDGEGVNLIFWEGTYATIFKQVSGRLQMDGIETDFTMTLGVDE